MNKPLALAVWAGIALISGQVLPRAANAGYSRNHFSQCAPEVRDGFFSDHLKTTGDGFQLDNATSAAVYCPYLDRSDVTRSSLTTLNVFVNDTTTAGRIEAVACTQDLDAVSTYCGTWDESGDTFASGTKTLSPSLSKWTETSGGAGSTAGDYAYLKVIWVASSNTSSLSFYGYYVGW